jgi:ribose transport system substrate-binding protein
LAIAASAVVAIGALAGVSATSGAAAEPQAKGKPTNSQLLALQGTYRGIESTLPAGYPAPTVKRGVKFTLGWLNPNGAIPGLNTQQAAAEAETKKLGGKFIAFNANASITLQVSQFNDLLAEHVSAIVVDPNDPSSLVPDLKRAALQHIPVETIFDAIAGRPPLSAGYATNIVQGSDQAAYYLVAATALQSPHASFAVIGFAAPIVTIEYWDARVKAWGAKLGLHYDGEVDVLETTPQGAATAMSAILARWPNIKAVFCFNDVTAESAAATADLAGKSNILVSGTSGDPAMRQAIKRDKTFATYQYTWQGGGQQAVIAAYDLVTKQHLPLPKNTVGRGLLVTRANPGAGLGL